MKQRLVMPRSKSEQRDTVQSPENLERQRLDKWLWAARFYKTRGLAVIAIDAGHVQVSGARAKPSREIRTGETIRVQRDALSWEVTVLALSARRGPALEAAALYRELEPSRIAREAAVAQRSAAYHAQGSIKGRPTKRMRRTLDRLLKESRRPE